MIDKSQKNGRRYVNIFIGFLETLTKLHIVEVTEIDTPQNAQNQAIVVDDIIKSFDFFGIISIL